MFSLEIAVLAMRRGANMEPNSWTLLVICAAKSNGLSPVQLHKSPFLLERRLPQEDLGERFYEFTPYNYGPFDVKIYQDAEVLQEKGLVAITQLGGRRWKTYRATSDGLGLAAKLRTETSLHALEYLDNVVEWVLGLSFRELVSAIYAEYPEFRANSV